MLTACTHRSIPPTAQIWKDQKRREEERREVLANVLRPLSHVIDSITIESRAMSEERNQWGRLSMQVIAISEFGIADLQTAKAWNVVLSVGQVRSLT